MGWERGKTQDHCPSEKEFILDGLEETTVDAGEQLGRETMVYFTRMMQGMTRKKQNECL